MKGLLGVLKKDVGVVCCAVEVEEAEVERVRPHPVLRGKRLGGQPMGRGQAQPTRLLGQKDGHARHQQGARQPLHNGLQQCFQIRLGTEAATKLDQRHAIVVAMAVEGAVNPALNPALQRLEEGSDQDDGDALAPIPDRLRQAVVGQPRGQGNDAEIAPEDEAGSQRISHTPLEDQIGIHQPVTDDGPAEGERQEDQRQPGQLGEQARHGQVQHVGNGVEEREGQNRQQRAAPEPLQLLA